MSRSWLVLLPVLLLSACSSTVVATPAPPSTTGVTAPILPPALTAEQALGDLTTIDYCSLLDTGKAKQAGVSGIETPVPAPDDCFAHATLDGQEIMLSVGDLGSKDADPGRTADVTARGLDEGLKIQATSNASPDASLRYLTFADGTHLDTDVFYTKDTEPTVDQRADLRKVGDAVLDGLITAVTGKSATHLSLPAGNVGTLDACAVLPDLRTILRSPFLDGLREIPVPGHHHCTWLDSVDYSQVEFSFDYGNLPGAPNVTIAGHRSQSTPGDWSCSIWTDVGKSPIGGYDELAILDVRAADATTDSCALAKSVAAAAWPKLPRA